jgi:sirohydrochlorin cobaltochelatase
MSDEPVKTRSALVLFAHGSRDARWAEPFQTIQQKLAARKPGATIAIAFLELMSPSLPDAVDRLAASGHKRVMIAPLFMGQGAHLRRDVVNIVAELRERHPGLDLAILPAAGEAEEVLEAVTQWLTPYI